MFPDLDFSLVKSLMPSRAQLLDTSDSALEGMKWLGGIGLKQTKHIYIWSIQSVQALYEIKWSEISMDQNFIQLISFEVLIGLVVSILMILFFMIIKKWKGQPKPEYEKRDRRFINQNSAIFPQAKKPWISNQSKVWMQKVICKIPLPYYLQKKCQQLLRNEESSKQLTRTNKPHTEENKPRITSFFKAEKPKPAPMRSASMQRRLRSEDEVQDSFYICRGTVHRLSQFEPGKINSKLTDIFERRSPPPQLQKPPKLRIVTPDQVFKKV